MKRREALKVLGGTVAGLVVADRFIGNSKEGAYAEEKPKFHKDILSAPGGKRVVIIGGGFSGVSFANTLRELAPDAEIVLLERYPFFVSGPSHIDYSVGMKKLEDATRSYYSLREKGVKVIKTEVGGILPEDSKVMTAKGNITYNYLMVSTGIRLADEEILQLSENPAYNAHTWELEGTIELRRRIETLKAERLLYQFHQHLLNALPARMKWHVSSMNFLRRKVLVQKLLLRMRMISLSLHHWLRGGLQSSRKRALNICRIIRWLR